MSKRRVVITGLGMVSPLGLDVPTSWAGIVAARSGIGPIVSFDTSAFGVRIGGAVKGFEAGNYLSPKEARKMDRFIHYGIAAAQEALHDGVEIAEEDRVPVRRQAVGVVHCVDLDPVRPGRCAAQPVMG